MNHPSISERTNHPFLIAGFLSFMCSVWLYAVQGETRAVDRARALVRSEF